MNFKVGDRVRTKRKLKLKDEDYHSTTIECRHEDAGGKCLKCSLWLRKQHKIIRVDERYIYLNYNGILCFGGDKKEIEHYPFNPEDFELIYQWEDL